MLRWLSCAIVIVGCGSEPPEPTRKPPSPAEQPTAKPRSAKDTRIAAIGDLSLRELDMQRALDPRGFEPMPEPEPGDWLDVHPEAPQPFAQYIDSSFHMPIESRNVIYLLPLGGFPPEAPPLAKLEAIVRAYFTLPVKVLPAVPIDKVEAKRRVHSGTGKRQLLAGEVLAWMARRVPEDAYAVMAVTMEDLYPEPSWNFVFGMASLSERVGVQSFARQDPAFFGDKRVAGWQQLALRRATWTLVHEISHMFGLPHCVYYRCVVAGSNNQTESDRAPLHPCPVCLHKLWWAIRFDPAKREEELANTLRALGIDDEAAWSEQRAKWIRDGTTSAY